MRPFNVLALALSPTRLIPQRLLLGCILILTVLLGGASGSLALPVAAPPIAAQSQAYCEELLVNPGFETRTGWELVGAESPPQYTTDRAYRGNWSMRLGIVSPTNVASISAAQQTVQIPTFASSLTLSMRYWPISGSGAGNDLQYIDIYNGYNNQFIKRIWSDMASITIMDMDGDGDKDEVDAAAQDWLIVTRDLNDIKGVTDKIRVFFAVTNDGGGGTTALYLDDVQLRACDTQPPATVAPTTTPSPSATVTTSPSPTASGTATATATVATSTPSITPTPSPVLTATQTPTPGPTAEGCQPIPNGGFESNSDWFFGQDPYPASYDTGERFSGARSMRLGVPADANTPNVPTYSSVRQLIKVPWTATNATLRYRMKFRTDEIPDENPSNISDRQELILLNPDLSTLAILSRHRYNTNSWESPVEQSLLGHRGEFYIYFNVYNDGNGARTWAYLDDVSVCITTSAAMPTPTITPVPAATSTAIPEAATSTPTATEPVVVVAALGTIVPDATLLAQAYALATQAAGTPVFDPNVQDAGQLEVGSNRPITPDGQVPAALTPVTAPSRLRLGNSQGLVILGIVMIVLVLILIFLAMVRRLGNREGESH